VLKQSAFILNKTVYFRDLGLIRYAQAWHEQRQRFEQVVAQKLANRERPAPEQLPTPNYLLFCEHPPVYTLGKSGQASHLLVSEAELTRQGIDYFPIDRGGDITFHGPSQLVGYPILDLENFFTDIHRYLRLIEEAVILTLAEYGLVAGRIDKLTGVWLDHERQHRPRKICAIGVKTSRWVTMHGFALNVDPDLRYFDQIVPCGIADKAVTSLAQELGRPVPLPEVAAKVLAHLAAQFGFQVAPEPTTAGAS
jgi:lipoyl(octanoyl) transferase